MIIMHLSINTNLMLESLVGKKTKLDKEIEKNHYGMLRNEIIQSYSQKIKNTTVSKITPNINLLN